jgi:hypothetical protein
MRPPSTTTTTTAMWTSTSMEKMIGERMEKAIDVRASKSAQ